MDARKRNEFEEKIARNAGRFLITQLKGIIKLVDQGIQRIPESFWQSFQEDGIGAFRGLFEEVFLGHALDVLRQSPLPVDTQLINTAAVEWAKTYSFEMIQGITATTRPVVETAVTEFFSQPGLTLGDLRNTLSSTFGPVRAEMIAVTETTRASVEGERAFADALKQQGVDFDRFWDTRNDDRVCPICGPLNGVKEDDSGGYTHPVTGTRYEKPPAHVRCRCGERSEVQTA